VCDLSLASLQAELVAGWDVSHLPRTRHPTSGKPGQSCLGLVSRVPKFHGIDRYIDKIIKMKKKHFDEQYDQSYTCSIEKDILANIDHNIVFNDFASRNAR
jgi:hypothetical protein